ncbi:MAG: 3-ketoacyl-ACP reductase [Clostridiaceae bacterium]|jgi:NAD(P)-dependent dehydrogenase (short-subunit alcohol dehydrogenase family)|nr:3-ketoacyl-ACP reductase [Clostridiaceae bacterium]
MNAKKTQQPVAMVTGGSRGIGLAVSRRLLADGFQLSILGTKPAEAIGDTLAELSQAGSVAYTQGDLGAAEDRARYLAGTLERFGRIDLLVNNAGVAPLVRADVLEMSEASYDRVMAINLKGPVFLSQLVARQMLNQPLRSDGLRGSIVVISSVSANTVSTSRAEYCLSKAGLSMLTQILAARLAEDAIPVYEIRPGIIQTDMTAGVRQVYDSQIAAGVFPMKRWGQPEDVADAVALLASGQLRYSTGDCLHVDGGFHIRRL